MRTDYFTDSRPSRSEFFRAVEKLPKPVFAAFGVVGMTLLSLAFTYGVGILALPLLAGFDPRLTQAIGLLLSFGSVWIFFLIYASITGFRGTGVTGQNFASRFLAGFPMALVLFAVVIAGVLTVGGVPIANLSFPTDGPFYVVALIYLGLFTIQGGAEELLFRGLLPRFLGRRCGPIAIIVLTTVLFALMHFNNGLQNPFVFANTGVLGVFMILLTMYTGSLWTAITFHGTWNLLVGVLLQRLFSPDTLVSAQQAVYLATLTVMTAASVTLVLLLHRKRPDWYRRPADIPALATGSEPKPAPV